MEKISIVTKKGASSIDEDKKEVDQGRKKYEWGKNTGSERDHKNT